MPQPHASRKPGRLSWLALLGLDGTAAHWRSLLGEGRLAAQDRLALAQLEWAEEKRRLAVLAALALVCFALLVAALVAVSLALLVQFWDTPARTLVAWLLAGGWLLLCAVAAALLLARLRRASRAFALTRHELCQDWQTFKEGL